MRVYDKSFNDYCKKPSNSSSVDSSISEMKSNLQNIMKKKEIPIEESHIYMDDEPPKQLPVQKKNNLFNKDEKRDYFDKNNK